MSLTLKNGVSKAIPLQVGQTLVAVAASGTYSASIVAGAPQSAIATDATGGTYGPYATSVVILLMSSAISEVDYDFGTAPAIVSDTPVMASTNPLTRGIDILGPDGAVLLDGSIYTWASKPAAAGNTGKTIRVSDVGVSAAGSHWVSDGSYWRPVGGSVLLGLGSGSIASPIQSLTGSTGAVFTSARTSIPANLLVPGCQIEMWAHFKRIGANGTGNISCCVGTTGTAADANVLGFGMAATNNLEYVPAPMIAVSSATTISSTAYMQVGGATAVGATNEGTVNFNVASPMFLSFYTASANALDTFNLIKYRVRVHF